ncbi:aminodeoxychorismate synthase component I [Deinococcus petrolearius]|uniref:Aminodeoxychorismate synthase component I n=1 Tax=Deinococcus petrolearius TaxID=1751295 RepID=A0ABW1DF94_9DEIO
MFSPEPSRPSPVTALLRFPGPGDSGERLPRWRLLRDPVRVVTAHTGSQVVPALAEVEAAVAGGLYAAGFVAYEAAPAFDPALVTHPAGEWPLLWFALFTEFEELDDLPGPAGSFRLGTWTPDGSEEGHAAAIAEIRRQIAGGNTYQVNHTLRLRAPFAGDDLALFAALSRAQPTRYSAYLNAGRWRVLSASPELFFSVSGGEVLTRPMKGTAPRGATPQEDAARAAALRASPKERAENLMIVDLLRNDLGRVARFGTVSVPRLFEIETHPTLHTMTSTVRAELRPGTRLADLFGALFPCGSVTGAPKVSTMRLIRALETSPRGVYCGAVGHLSPEGEMAFNVPIRTVTLDMARGEAEYGVGSGVTWDSTPGGEYAEVLTKAAVVRGLVGRGGQ